MRFLIISILLVSFTVPSSRINKKISKKDFATLYAPLFETFKAEEIDDLSKCCSYGYVRPGENQYYEGFNGIFLWSNYSHKGVKDLLHKKGIPIPGIENRDFYDIQHFEALAGINMFQSESPDITYVPFRYSPSDFGHYNPEFIRWATKNLIPKSDLSINGITAKYVYQHFSRFFRLLTESYLFLKSSGNYDEQAKTYINNLQSDNLTIDGLEYLEHYYSNHLTNYSIPSTSEVFSPFKPSMAFGFWLRRNIDGTHKELFKGLSIIMKRFDKKWFREVQKNYK